MKKYFEETLKQVVLSLSDLLLFNQSLYRAWKDIVRGEVSKTLGPVDVWYLPNKKKYLVTDGQHRLVDLITKQKVDRIKATIIGEGYSNIWAIPYGKDIFEYHPDWKYYGLESVISIGKEDGEEVIDLFLDKEKKLFLDDIRNAPDDSWDVVRSYEEFINYIQKNGVPDVISFDHDLGEGKDGYDCAKWLVRNEYEINDFYSHSANPVGRKNIIKLLSNWKKFKNGE